MILDREPADIDGRRRRLHAARAFALAHPCASIAVVAGVARLAVALVSFKVNHGYLIPDEREYMELARTLASGKSSEAWVPFYGHSLYVSTWTYLGPLVQLLKLFGDSRLVGQLYTCILGVAAAALGTRLLRVVTTAGWAFLGGLIFALLPSQVVFSSVVLREADVWLGLAIVVAGGFLLASDDVRRMATGVLIAGVGLLGIGFLRQQTLVAAAWALVAGAVLVGRRRLLPRSGGALALALVVPIVAGLGIGGWTLVDQALPNLGRTRTVLSLGADTGFTPTTIIGTTDTTAPPPSPSPGKESPGALGIARRQNVPASDGNTYLVDEGLHANLSSIPRGLLANVLRPFPWESGRSVSFRLARVESLVWYVLYAFAAIGAVVAARRPPLRRLLAFPALLAVAVLIIAALTQGNLGTAYRHRQQVALPVMLFAVVGAEWSWARWQARRPVPEMSSIDEPAPISA